MKVYPFNYNPTKTVANKNDRSGSFLLSLRKISSALPYRMPPESWSRSPSCRSVIQKPKSSHGDGPCWCWCSQTFSQGPNHTRRRVFEHSVLRSAEGLVAIAPTPRLGILGSLSTSCRHLRAGRGLQLYYESVKSAQGTVESGPLSQTTRRSNALNCRVYPFRYEFDSDGVF